MKPAIGDAIEIGWQRPKDLNSGLALDFVAYSKALCLRQEWIAEFSTYSNEYDFIIGPKSARAAFQYNPKHRLVAMDDKTKHYSDACIAFVMPFNAMGNPVLVVSAQQTPEKLPIGLQCIGRHHSEPQLLHLGKLLGEAGYRFKPPELQMH